MSYLYPNQSCFTLSRPCVRTVYNSPQLPEVPTSTAGTYDNALKPCGVQCKQRKNANSCNSINCLGIKSKPSAIAVKTTGSPRVNAWYWDARFWDKMLLIQPEPSRFQLSLRNFSSSSFTKSSRLECACAVSENDRIISPLQQFLSH